MRKKSVLIWMNLGTDKSGTKTVIGCNGVGMSKAADKSWYDKIPFFWAYRDNHQTTPAYHDGAEDSVRHIIRTSNGILIYHIYYLYRLSSNDSVSDHVSLKTYIETSTD